MKSDQVNCSLDGDIEVSVLACPYDTQFLALTVPHLIKSIGNVKALKTLLVDWNPVSGTYSTTYPERQEEKFKEICKFLLTEGWIDRVDRIYYEPDYVEKFLGANVKGEYRAKHDFRGYPTYGLMHAVLNSGKRYFVHFDSDMLIHQGAVEGWIDSGISLLKENNDIGAIMPKGGPPRVDGVIFQENYLNDPRGFHSFSSFSSRLFLVDTIRFLDFHPVKPLWLGSRDKLRSFWDGKGKSMSWEAIITQAFLDSNLVRADLRSNDSWSLHPPVKNEMYLKWLPSIISSVEAGDFPPEQAGHYDINLKWWIKFLQDSQSIKRI